MTQRRAKVCRCAHGVIHSAHGYTVGDEASEREADQWVAESLWPGDATDDVSASVIGNRKDRSHERET